MNPDAIVNDFLNELRTTQLTQIAGAYVKKNADGAVHSCCAMGLFWHVTVPKHSKRVQDEVVTEAYKRIVERAEKTSHRSVVVMNDHGMSFKEIADELET